MENLPHISDSQVHHLNQKETYEDKLFLLKFVFRFVVN